MYEIGVSYKTCSFFVFKELYTHHTTSLKTCQYNNLFKK
nr:MAG TPA: hypothetical protein [Caudoviricetes sp.]